MSKDWQAVADAINTRMEQLGLSQKELSERSKVSPATLRLMQQGANASRSATTLAAVSTALGWKADHLGDVAAGRPASGDVEQDLRDEVQALRGEVAELRAGLEGLTAKVARLSKS
ncbi:helix-turn-helix transcriptional regulator [Lentzea sp. BCCO 10_0798]|uniref:Helix-turn-helix transcriptional regulator n=1 Tax=Lentzea kristufekii TaxID=3095430 RepID=A0ABU4U802_9PSEU|nr:helix-turn-helix transcriptional regulator [Lentzea sp. BCCO 10_0798]MDX8056071.1 helix-turn-helix transcriptional regulator [Lentzea sp. BCCO 10_0798]